MPGQRLISQLDLFKEPAVVLEDPKYWNADFARLFIEAWDDVAYVDAAAGVELASVAVELVSRLDREAQKVLMPRALATVGSSHRRIEEVGEAAKVLDAVGELYAQTRLPRLDEADFCRRAAYVKLDQRSYHEAVEFADRAIGLCEAEAAAHDLGRSYAARAAVYLDMMHRGESVPKDEPTHSLNEAIKRIDPRRGPYAYEAVIRNLAVAFLLMECHFDLQSTLASLNTAKRLQAKLRLTRKSLPNAQLRWTFGLVYLRAGMLPRAESELRRTRRVLKDLGLAHHFVLISIDLAQVYDELGWWGEFRKVAEEILKIEVVHSHEGLVALQIWHKAVCHRRVTSKIWREVQRTVRWAPQTSTKTA